MLRLHIICTLFTLHFGRVNHLIGDNYCHVHCSNDKRDSKNILSEFFSKNKKKIIIKSQKVEKSSVQLYKFLWRLKYSSCVFGQVNV